MFPSPPAFGILLNAIHCNIKSFMLVFSVAFDFAICWILCDVELCPFFAVYVFICRHNVSD